MTARDAEVRPTASQSRRTRVAILGFGTVGQSVARLLGAQNFTGIDLAYIFNRGIERKQSSEAAMSVPETAVWTDSIEDVLGSDTHVVIETIGGLDPMDQWLRAAMRSGKSVVTANKQLIAYRGAELTHLAREQGVQLRYNASVAGGVPVIPATLDGLQGDRITRLSGIVNGTCNFILSHMEAGAEYGESLRQAQAAGYAEADPRADVDGLDARAKLCILSRIALHAELNPDQVATQSISAVAAIDFQYARELGCTIRQVSRAQLPTSGGAPPANGGAVRARVAPMLVPLASPIAWSHGTQNMVVTSGEFGGDVVFSGHGAGGNPTAVAIVSDLLSVAQGCSEVSLPVTPMEVTGEFFAPHYLRFMVSDKPGIVSAISGALATVGANIDSLLQRPGYPKDHLPFVVTTEPCLTSTISRAVATIAQFECMLEPPLSMQMLTIDDKAED